VVFHESLKGELSNFVLIEIISSVSKWMTSLPKGSMVWYKNFWLR